MLAQITHATVAAPAAAPGSVPPGTAPPGTAPEDADGRDLRIVTVPPHRPTTEWPAAPAGPGAAGALDGARDSGPSADEEPGAAWPRQFAVLLVEALAGVRPARQLLPWLSDRGRAHLHRLLPGFAGDARPRILRVLTAHPAPDVIEMTLIVAIGPRARALAVRLEQAGPAWPARRPAAPQWRCTDIEAA